MTDDPTTKYLIKTRNDEFIIDLPSNWKVTFATVNPAATGHRDEHCVRVYEMPGSKLRAVFDSAVSIRDLSIPLARKNRSETGTATWTRDDMGNVDRNLHIEAESSFVVDPDQSPF